MSLNKIKSDFFVHFKRWIGPLLLIIACPSAAMIIWFTCTHLGGSLQLFLKLCFNKGFFDTFYKLWAPYVFGSKTAWQLIIIFGLIQIIFMKYMPGKLFYGPMSPKGNIPIYKQNGVISFLATITLFCVCTFYLKLFSPTIIFDNFGGIIGVLNFFSLCFCLFLYFKGCKFPSSMDCGTSRSFIFDYYWGVELYPKIMGLDVKMFINCRVGMMSWALIIISFAAKQSALYGLSDSMLVALCLQLIYIFKFFCWETGYLSSLDIMHDRAGFYICWGCLVWVPAIYTSPILYLVNHPNHLGNFLATLLFVVGLIALFINYQADRQRQKFRLSKGSCLIWGKKPKFITATFLTDNNEKKENLLLYSGWWGISRHFHYIPELLVALCWSLPALFDNILPYFYFLFLLVLLFHRARRDDERCSKKYKKCWEEYCKKVPFKIIPFIY